ncbi:MAG: protein kinase [Pseudomonadota bacterium]
MNDTTGKRERWQRVEHILDAAIDLPAESGARARLLDESCAGDAPLRHAVESLLANESAAREFLETPALDVAAQMLNSQPGADLTGRRIGPYVVTGWLGAGGMGDVYRARDERLKRDVALKILPELFARDPERLARFTQEAQLLASLHHANIAAIHGFEESDGVRAIALELVDGPTLADRIAKGAVDLDEALSMARQVAEALEAAHEQGIVHRDLKPSNIGLSPDGAVKVLDFGIATWHRGASTPTEGNLLGTPAYTSPEQVRGRAADKRSDVWAFGAVLYEMLAGRPVFVGERTAEVLRAVQSQEIDWSALPASTPPPVQALLRRCLERDARQRLRDIGEARIVLENPRAATGGAAPARNPRGAGRVLAWSVLAAAVIVGAASFLRSPSPPAVAGVAPLPVTRFTYVLPDSRKLALPIPRHAVAISPDGTAIVYASADQLYLQRLAETEARPIAGSELPVGIAEPTFSPDGRSIAFWSASDRTIRILPLVGGTAMLVCKADPPYGLSWSGDSLFFGVRQQGIMRVSAKGGTPELAVRVEFPEQVQGPQLLPDGKHLIFTIATGNNVDRWDRSSVVVQLLSGGQRRTLLENATDARYVATGHLVYGTREGVFAVPFDAQRLEITGAPVATIAAVRRSQGRATGAVHVSVSANGSAAFIPGALVSLQYAFKAIVVATRAGARETLPVPDGLYKELRVSPDGRQLAIAMQDPKEDAIFIYELSGKSPLRRLTFGGNSRAPIWSSDGKRVLFQSDREGDQAIYWQFADGSAPAARLTRPSKGESHMPESYRPSGDGFLYTNASQYEMSLWWYSLRDHSSKPFGDIHSTQPIGAVFSPDGNWVAYVSMEPVSAVMGIYVQPFPVTGARYPLLVGQLSDAPANSPHKPAWSPDGKELFYVPRLGDFDAVRVTTEPTFTFGNPVRVPRDFLPGPPDARRVYDVTPDGRFVGLISKSVGYADELTGSKIHVILNWLQPAASP